MSGIRCQVLAFCWHLELNTSFALRLSASAAKIVIFHSSAGRGEIGPPPPARALPGTKEITAKGNCAIAFFLGCRTGAAL